MQRCAVACALVVALGGAAAADEACQAKVAEAFNKQRQSRAFVMSSELKAAAGPVQVRVEYQPPDRMRQVITAPQQTPLETVLYGKRAYTRQGAKWEELMPAVAQTIIAQVRSAVIDPPQNVGDFECLGTISLDGKAYVAYRSVERQADAGAAQDAPVLHRTIYVDPQSGLPGANIVAGEGASDEAVFKATYEYPENLEIEDHPDAPLVKKR